MNNEVAIELKTPNIESFEVQIVNTVGEIIFSKEKVTGSFIWDSSSVLSGFYIVTVVTENHEKASTKVMIIK
ncbi:MAG: T9SS type A sorting domain-containing protein [Crocinitomicaceae bacterium]|nr:T9SS type A sorting domain-containing protein [Crocinitomicaceae bacterium]